MRTPIAAAPVAAAFALAAAAVAQEPALSPEAQAFRAHVATLADDGMRGREAGSPDYDRAAAYVADQLARAGATPGAAGEWRQPVPLATAKAAGQGSIAVVSGDRAVALAFGSDYQVPLRTMRARIDVDAPVVFVGYGVSAPGQGHDDYAGVDVRGKVVAYFTGAPGRMQGEVRAHFGNAATKAIEARRRGAVATLSLVSPTTEKRTPFARSIDQWQTTSMAWRQPDGTGFSPGAASAGALSQTGADKLFAHDPALLARARAAEEKGEAIAAAVLPVRIRAAFANTLGRAESSNVVGLIAGSDPALKDEYVVLSAHLDHVGVGTPRNGDAIYNGAMDNAAGIATLIEVARRFGAGAARPKRSILLVAVTAEEKGLVGSDYFARNPTVPIDRIVANVNLDMPILTYAFTDVIAFGADRSSLGPIVRAAVAPLGLAMSPDPDPREGVFTRSDHYRFVQQGVPAVFLKNGFAGEGAAAIELFRRTHYHQPSDDLSRPIRWDMGARFVEANHAIARAIADAPQRPAWNKGDFFGTLYRGRMAR